MEQLLRTRVSEFSLSDAKKIGEIEELVHEYTEGVPPQEWNAAMFPFVSPVDAVFSQYSKAIVPDLYAKPLYNGNRIEPEMLLDFQTSMTEEPIRIYDEKEHFIGIYEFQQERGNFKPVKVFMEE